MPKYSIIIPAYEEATLIVSTLTAVQRYLKEEKLLDETEVVVVAAKGKDSTAQLARSQAKNFRHFQLIEPGPKVGKGRDVKAGIEAARGDFLLFTDADLATPEHHIKPAFEVLADGQADIVIGVRDLWSIHKDLYRKLVSVIANWLVRTLLPTVPDSQCGFKGFSKEAAEKIFTKLTIVGWGFDIELLVIAKAKKLSIKKLKIKDWHDPKLEAGLVGEATSSAVMSTLKELLAIWKNRLKGAYR